MAISDNFPKIFPHLSPITPVVTGTQSMSLYELCSYMVEQYNKLIDEIGKINPDDYNAAREAAEAAKAAAESAASNAALAQASVAAFAPQVTDAVEKATAAVSIANNAAHAAEEAVNTSSDALDQAHSALLAVSEIPAIRQAAQAAQTAAESAAVSASGANASAAAAVAAVDGKLDKTGGTITGVVTFAGSGADLVMEEGTEISGDGAISLTSARFTSVATTGDVSASGIVTGRRIDTTQGIRISGSAGSNINIYPGTSEGSGESYVGVLNINSTGPALDERNKFTALRGIIGTGDNDAVSMSQIGGIAETAADAKQTAEAAAAAVDGKLDKAGGIITGNLTVNGNTQCGNLQGNTIVGQGIVGVQSIMVGGAQASVNMYANPGISGNVLNMIGMTDGRNNNLPVAIRNVQSQGEGDAVCRREVTT